MSVAVGDVQCASKLFKNNQRKGSSDTVEIKPEQIICIIRQCSKPALTEGLEIDQYIWAILNTLGTTQIEEVIIDSDANWKSVHGIGSVNIKV